MTTNLTPTEVFIAAIEDTDIDYAIQAALSVANVKLREAADRGDIEAAKFWAKVGDHLSNAHDLLIPF